MKNNILKGILSILLAVMICFNFVVVSYADQPETEIDYDYIQKVLTEVGTIEEYLNSMGFSFSDVMKAEFKNEEMNRTIAEAFLSQADNDGLNQLLNNNNASQDMLRNTDNKDNTNNDDTKEKVKKYSERLCYARKIAEKNKKRDNHAKDIDSETVYMYISHYLDIPGGPSPLNMPVDSNSEDGLYSAWITNEDRKVYENYLSFELKKKAREASAAFETYAQLAHKEQSLEGLIEYEENLSEMMQAMKNYDERYAYLALIATIVGYKPLTISNYNVGELTIELPFNWKEFLGPKVDFKNGKLKMGFNVKLWDVKQFIDDMHTFYKDKLGIENKAMRDLYIGMGLSMAGILRYASSFDGGWRAFRSGIGSRFMQYVLVDTANQLYYDSMLVNTLVMNRQFYSYVNWLAMAYTAPSRAALRFMRYMGM